MHQHCTYVVHMERCVLLIQHKIICNEIESGMIHFNHIILIYTSLQPT